jgi:hypothetical protein
MYSMRGRWTTVHKTLILSAKRNMPPPVVGPPDQGYGVDERSPAIPVNFAKTEFSEVRHALQYPSNTKYTP